MTQTAKHTPDWKHTQEIIAERDRLKALNEELAGTLEAALNVAEEARKEWDASPQGMKAGKLLCALTDKNINYRADISAIHAAIAKHKAGGK